MCSSKTSYLGFVSIYVVSNMSIWKSTGASQDDEYPPDWGDILGHIVPRDECHQHLVNQGFLAVSPGAA